MASVTSSSLKDNISSYHQVSIQNQAELDRAKQDFNIIKEFLTENIKAKHMPAVNYGGIKPSPHLAEAVRVTDAYFELTVMIEEKGTIVKALSDQPGCLELSGLSPGSQLYNSNAGQAVEWLSSDVTMCLQQLMKESPEFAGCFAIRVNDRTLICEIIVYERANPDNGPGVPHVPRLRLKATGIVPPWFSINVKPVVCHGDNCYMLTTMPGSVWFMYTEDDPLDRESRPVCTVLQALLSSKPLLCEHSTHDIAASAVALYAAATISGTTQQVEWSGQLEERLLGVVEELEKAYMHLHLPHYRCPTVNMLATTSTKPQHRMARVLTGEVNKILEAILARARVQ